MKDKVRNLVVICVIVIAVLLPIIIPFIRSGAVSTKNYNYFSDKLSNTTFSLVYFGSTDKDEYKPYKTILKNLKKEYKIDTYTVDITKLSETERKTLTNLNEELKNQNVFVIVRDGEIIYANSNQITEEELSAVINKWGNGIIPEEEVVYKTVSTYKEYMALVNSKKIVMAVFGRNSCGWCNRFKPVYNEVATENNLDVYYFDSDSFDTTEYSKILNSDLKIPAKCTDTGEAQKLSDGFGTPLTLFTKEGKVINCISGYVNKTRLTSILKETGMIK